MMKITILGLVLVAIALSGVMSVAMSVASAETVPSPLQQVRNGVPADEVVCSYGRILMTSPSGAPACVFAESIDALERRGFATSSGMPSDDLLVERPETSEKDGGASSAGASKTGDRPFVTTWQTISPNESITIPVGGAIGTYTVDWGDGSTSDNVAGDQSHAYEGAGTYTVAVTGNFERIRLNGDLDNAPKLQSIEQWGDVRWTSMESAFSGASNMIYNATDVPNLSDVTNMSYMFYDSHFNGDLSGWDVSSVTYMYGMFWDASFNGDLSGWDVSSVTHMSEMFRNSAFNGDISEWDVSGVTYMYAMFAGASSFNGDISEWDVSGVADMSGMFANTDSFNGDISEWDVSGVTRMHGMFANTDSFNSDISEWDVSGVTSMSKMFLYADSFNGDISEWDVSGVAGMYYMFSGASAFNGDISGWDVSSVTNMDRTFDSASSFNGDISEWDVSDVARMSWMFSDADSFNGDISGWDVSSVTDMSKMFAGADAFNGDISPWDVSGVTDMSKMFAGADSFTQNLGSWYITLNGTFIDDGDATRAVGNISAQNSFLGGQSLRYSIAPGGDGDAFEIDGTALKLKSTPNYTSKSSYTVTISSTGEFGTSNSETFKIRVV